LNKDDKNCSLIFKNLEGLKVKIRGLLLQDTCFVQLVLVSNRTALYLVKEPASLLDQIQSIDTTTQER
jgi:hypothetical protein